MRIDNNLNAMMQSQLQVQETSENLANIANVVGDPEFQEASQDIIDSLVSQIPEVIAYSANAQGVQTQNAVADTLINIKA